MPARIFYISISFIIMTLLNNTIAEKLMPAMNYRKICFAAILLTFALPAFPQSGAFGALKGNAIEIYNTGRQLESQGQMQEAETWYSQAVKICNDEISQNNANRDTYTALTWTLLRQKKYSDVITWGERGLRIYADEYRILETMGEAFFYLEDYESSLRYMQRYANLMPRGDRVSVAYFFAGEIYRIQQKFRLADMAYSTAVKLQPEIALWWYRLGLVRESCGEPVPAADAYGQAIKLSPGYQAAADGLARVRKAAQ